MLRRVTVLMILVALIMAALPVGVLAKGNIEYLEDKWDQLTTSYYRQSLTHNGAHNWVVEWLDDHKNASASQKAALQWHLTICNSALGSAQTIVWRHAGFDANGKVIDRSLAVKSVKDLTFYLQQHAASLKNLQEHMK